MANAVCKEIQPKGDISTSNCPGVRREAAVTAGVGRRIWTGAVAEGNVPGTGHHPRAWHCRWGRTRLLLDAMLSHEILSDIVFLYRREDRVGVMISLERCLLDLWLF